MARAFDDGSNQYLSQASTPVTAPPFAVSAWGYSDDATVTQTAFTLGEAGVTNRHYSLIWEGNAAGDPLRLYTRDAVDAAVVDTTTGYSASTWHHGCAVVSTTTSGAVYIDGGSKGSSDALRNPTPDGMAIGARIDWVGWHFSGNVAEVALWNAALVDAEVAALAAGAPPTLVRPSALVGYWPELRSDQDLVGGYDMTPQNGPTWAAHAPAAIPPWYRPRGWLIPAVVAAILGERGVLRGVGRGVGRGI